MSDGCGCGANGCEHIDAEGLARLLSAGSALAEAMKVALPWLELRANYDTVVACGAALTAWEEATKGREPIVCPLCGVKNWDPRAAEVHAEFCASLRDADVTTKTKGDGK
jgi:hypothetical protein